MGGGEWTTCRWKHSEANVYNNKFRIIRGHYKDLNLDLIDVDEDGDASPNLDVLLNVEWNMKTGESDTFSLLRQGGDGSLDFKFQDKRLFDKLQNALAGRRRLARLVKAESQAAL